MEDRGSRILAVKDEATFALAGVVPDEPGQARVRAGDLPQVAPIPNATGHAPDSATAKSPAWVALPLEALAPKASSRRCHR